MLTLHKVDYKTIKPDDLNDTISIVAKLKAFVIYESEDLNKKVIDAIKVKFKFLQRIIMD